MELHLIFSIMRKTEKIERNNKRISQKIEALGDSLQKLNHDVRSPINGIIGLADLLIEDKEHVKVRTKDIIMIKESAETIIDIIDGVLSGIDGNQTSGKKQEKKDISVVINKIKRLYNPVAYKKGISLKFTGEAEGIVKISHKQSVKLLQIIGNLVSNAIKFTPENGTIEITTAGISERDRVGLSISVEDNGTSMSADQTKSFNTSQPVQRSTGTNGEVSFGLGLKHVKQLVSGENGTISVSSEPGKGTKFNIYLPVEPEEEVSSNQLIIG